MQGPALFASVPRPQGSFPERLGCFHPSCRSIAGRQHHRVCSRSSPVSVCAPVAPNSPQGARPTTRQVGVDDARGVSPFVSVAKTGHFLPAWVSLSPNLPSCGLGRPRGVTPLGARRSCPSSITSRQLRRSGPAWRAGPVKDWLDGIGLAARHDARRRAPWWTADPRRPAAGVQGPGMSSARAAQHRPARARLEQHARRISGVGKSAGWSASPWNLL